MWLKFIGFIFLGSENIQHKEIGLMAKNLYLIKKRKYI